MTKAKKISYWIFTIWLALGMASSGIVQLSGMQENVDMMHHLGYPAYVLIILGVWKLLGALAILIPKFPVVKEWAYAGFFFVSSGALISHIAVNDPFGEIFPGILLMALTVVSWWLRPDSRKLTAGVQA